MEMCIGWGATAKIGWQWRGSIKRVKGSLVSQTVVSRAHGISQSSDTPRNFFLEEFRNNLSGCWGWFFLKHALSAWRWFGKGLMEIMGCSSSLTSLGTGSLVTPEPSRFSYHARAWRSWPISPGLARALQVCAYLPSPTTRAKPTGRSPAHARERADRGASWQPDASIGLEWRGSNGSVYRHHLHRSKEDLRHGASALASVPPAVPSILKTVFPRWAPPKTPAVSIPGSLGPSAPYLHVYACSPFFLITECPSFAFLLPSSHLALAFVLSFLPWFPSSTAHLNLLLLALDNCFHRVLRFLRFPPSTSSPTPPLSAKGMGFSFLGLLDTFLPCFLL